MPPPRCGAFQAAAAQVAFCVHESAGSADEMATLANELFSYPLNLDPWSLGGSPSIISDVAVEAQKTFRAVARAVTAAPWAEAAQESLSASYDGSAHLKIAKTLLSNGDHERAYVACINAAYFPASRESAFKTARSTAKDAGWVHVTKSLAAWDGVKG